MNITHFWPSVDTAPELNTNTILDLLERRRRTFTGFAEIEKNQGFIQPTISLSTARGQDTERLLAFRVIEEAQESISAISTEHRSEEAIDAINYLVSLLLLDANVTPPDEAVNCVFKGITEYFSFPHSRKLELIDLGSLSQWLAGDLAEVLRNRTWMHNAQDIYFSHANVIYEVIQQCLYILLAPFPDWDTFWKYYVAKDLVLQFRLDTGY